jgi:hypothetical protein
MSNPSRVTLRRDRKRLMPAGIEKMLVHLTGRRGLLPSLDVDRTSARGASGPEVGFIFLNCRNLNSPQIHGTHVPVEEPSTASSFEHLVGES